MSGPAGGSAMSVLAVYKNRIYRVGDSLAKCELVEGPTVDFGDPDLTVAPTDSQLADAENLGEFFGATGDSLSVLIRTLTES